MLPLITWMNSPDLAKLARKRPASHSQIPVPIRSSVLRQVSTPRVAIGPSMAEPIAPHSSRARSLTVSPPIFNVAISILSLDKALSPCGGRTPVQSLCGR
jgi:hypothetical protein